jgi:hypothetical protein
MLVHGKCLDTRTWLPSTTTKIVTPHIPNTRPTPWTALSLDVLPPLMQYWSTIHKTNIIMNRIATGLTHIVSHHQYPNIIYNGGLFVSLHWDNSPQIMHFHLMVTPDKVKVHLSQTGFASHLMEDHNIHLCNITPDATPYRSGLPIDACPEPDEDKESPTFIKCKRKYQSIVGSIGWLAQTTRPDLAPSHSLLLAYFNKPSHSHLNAALYVLHYIHSTIDYGFTFSSNATVPLHTCMSFPHRSDTNAYVDAVPPKPGDHHRLTTYSDACWGSQISKAIQAGIQLPLFKFQSMSGEILFCLGGPITWKADRQDWTSLSSCEAEIRATNMGS